VDRIAIQVRLTRSEEFDNAIAVFAEISIEQNDADYTAPQAAAAAAHVEV